MPEPESLPRTLNRDPPCVGGRFTDVTASRRWRVRLVDTGRQQHVFVAVGDTFEPRPVILGVQLADRVEVREGLVDGDRIVASGVFLLDSESRLRATGGMGGHNHGSTPTPESAPAPPPKPPPSPPGAPHAGHRE